MLHTEKQHDLSKRLCLTILTFVNVQSGLMQGLLKTHRAVYVRTAAKNGSDMLLTIAGRKSIAIRGLLSNLKTPSDATANMS